MDHQDIIEVNCDDLLVQEKLQATILYFFYLDFQQLTADTSEENHLVVIHREKKSEDDLDEVLTILLSKNYGRSKILFGKLT